MNLSIRGVRDWTYLALGVMNLFIALLITLGGLFSSLGFGFGAVLLVDLPIAFGLIGLFEYQKPLTLLMAFGCTVIVIYIADSTYFSITSGFPMLFFHKVWAGLSLILIALSIFRFMQLRQAIGTPS
jgi:hypothetical protein